MQSSETVRYFDDCEVGQRFGAGSHTVTREEIVEFAERYDPQPFHVDEELAASSIFGELIASGWHTAAICTRLFVEGPLADVASAGGIGVDELRWHKPVTPGDELSVEGEIVETDPAEDLPGLGYVHTAITGVDQDGEPVVSWTLLGMVEQRG